jgi:hypothetical protein
MIPESFVRRIKIDRSSTLTGYHRRMRRLLAYSLKMHMVPIVCELMGRVHNVVLIECTLGLEKPKKGRDFGWEGTLAGNE